MKKRNLLIPGMLLLVLYGCSSNPIHTKPVEKTAETTTANNQACIGNTDLPDSVSDQFQPADDQTLLQSALGEANKGKLCQGKVYQTKPAAEILIYRAWNSTNPHSKLGRWWAFYEPAGKVATYRADYEICYQWSPLDKLVKCKLKPATKVVIGTGQSAECSQYLTYPVSNKQQIYISDASVAVAECTEFDGEFSWKPIN